MYRIMILSILLLLLEVVLAVYRIKTHSMQQRLIAVLRTASLLILITLCALSVLTWGFRYYALSTVLVISAVVNAARFLNKRVTATKLQPVRIIWKAAGMSALLFIALLPAITFPEYRLLPTTGEYQVVTAIKHFSDESRIEVYTKHSGARTLTAEFWYPSDTKGNFPLVVFSHGSFGARTSNETLYRELASHGYAVCSIDHTYQCFYTTDKSGNILLMSSEFMGEIRSENAKKDKQKSLELYRKWMDVRVGDINFVIDTIKTDSDVMYGLINTERSGRSTKKTCICSPVQTRMLTACISQESGISR
jgi:hypothetical protein